MIEICSIIKKFRKHNGDIYAVDGLSWQAAPGTFSVVFGKSGSGKSTLLMMIGGMMTPTEGRVKVNGQDIYGWPRGQRNRFRKESVGFIFQKFLLLPYFTVYDNIALPLAMNRADGIEDRVLSLARDFELDDRLDHYPSELSVGQQQRVAMARALVKDPDILLADEPTGNLDRENGEIIVRRLLESADAGKTVIVVTHDEHLLDKAHRKLHLVDGKAEDTR